MARLGVVHMAKVVIVIYRIHETILILINFKRSFSIPKNQYITKVVLNFREALSFWAKAPRLCNFLYSTQL